MLTIDSLRTPSRCSLAACSRSWFLCSCQAPTTGSEDEVFSNAPLFPWFPCCCRLRTINASATHQALHLAMVMGANTMFMYHKMFQLPIGISVTELLLMNVLVLLRAATIAAKYSFFSLAEYAQTVKAPLDGLNDRRKTSKLVLAGWLTPSAPLLYTELERAAARNSPGLDTMTVTFPSDEARLTAMEQMRGSIPDFLVNEAAVLHPRCVAFIKAFLEDKDALEPMLREDAERAMRSCAKRRRASLAMTSRRQSSQAGYDEAVPMVSPVPGPAGTAAGNAAAVPANWARPPARGQSHPVLVSRHRQATSGAGVPGVTGPFSREYEDAADLPAAQRLGRPGGDVPAAIAASQHETHAAAGAWGWVNIPNVADDSDGADDSVADRFDPPAAVLAGASRDDTTPWQPFRAVEEAVAAFEDDQAALGGNTGDGRADAFGVAGGSGGGTPASSGAEDVRPAAHSSPHRRPRGSIESRDSKAAARGQSVGARSPVALPGRGLTEPPLPAASSADGRREPASRYHEDRPVLYDTQGMATIPAKLLAWHTVRTTHTGVLVSFGVGLVPRLIGLAIGTLPLISRATMTGSPTNAFASWTPLEITTTILVVFLTSLNARITISFCALGAMDLYRRFRAQVLLHRLLDIRSPATMQMHDAVVRSAGGTFHHAMVSIASEHETSAIRAALGARAEEGVEPEHDPATVSGRSSDKARTPAAAKLSSASKSSNFGGLGASAGGGSGGGPTAVVAPPPAKHRQVAFHGGKMPAAGVPTHSKGASTTAILRKRVRTTSKAESRTTLHEWREAWDQARPEPSIGRGRLASAQSALGRRALVEVPMSAPPEPPRQLLISPLPPPRSGAVSNAHTASRDFARMEAAGKPSLGRDDDTVRRLIMSQATWLRPDEAQEQVAKWVTHVRLPVFYPENLLVWLHVRNTTADLARSYSMRIQLYTLFFALLVGFIVVGQGIIFFGATTSGKETLVILVQGTFVEVVFAAIVVLQMTLAARTNRSISFQRRRFNRIEAVTQDLLSCYPEPMHEATTDRLKRCRKVLSLLAKSLDSEDDLNPVRVLFVRADFTLLASFISIAASGAFAALSSIPAIRWGEIG